MTRFASSLILLALTPLGYAAPAQWEYVGAPLGTQAHAFSLAEFDDGAGRAVYATVISVNGGGALVGNGVVKWDGQQWSMVGRTLGAGASAHAVLAHDDGSGPALYVTGNFETIAAVPNTLNNARLRNHAWEPVRGQSPGPGGRFLVAYPSPEGPRLIAGGGASSQGESAGVGVSQWDGQRWSPLGAGVSYALFDRSVATTEAMGQPELLLINADRAGGLPMRDLARWNGRRWRALGSGTLYAINSVATTPAPDSRIFVGTSNGAFPFTSPVYEFRDGVWIALPGEFYSAARVEVVDEGVGSTLFAFGQFSDISGVPIKGIARWDGDSWIAAGAGLEGTVNDLLRFVDAAGHQWLYACGRMYFPGTGNTYPVARIRMECALGLYGDANADGSVDFLDLNLVISTFGAVGSPGFIPSDLNGDGHVDFLDLNLVLANFGIGC